MECWAGLSYDSIMAMPVTRRHRLMLQKNNLERKRQENQQAAVQQARARARRR